MVSLDLSPEEEEPSNEEPWLDHEEPYLDYEGKPREPEDSSNENIPPPKNRARKGSVPEPEYLGKSPRVCPW